MIDKLIRFAKENHPGFRNVSDDFLRTMFETYKDTTIVNMANGTITGFGIYQEWPELLNFICIVGNPEQDKIQNIIAMLDARNKVPDKKIVYFDESKKELRICR